MWQPLGTCCGTQQARTHLLWATILLCLMACARGSMFSADMLVKAVNEVYELGGAYADAQWGGPAEYSDWLQEVPARLRSHKVWWSSKTPANATLTVATVTTMDRLDQLEAQCSSWAGPLSAVVYLPIGIPPLMSTIDKAAIDTAKKELEDAEEEVKELLARTEKAAGTGCFLDLQMLYEYILADPLMKTWLPINSLRNFALVQARTPLVAMIDVDLLISSSLALWLQKHDNSEQLLQLCKDKAVVVLPAFETEEYPGSDEGRHLITLRKMATVTAQFDKQGLLTAMMKQGLIQPFDVYTHPKGHRDTDYSKWFNASQLYASKMTSPEYEPWFIIGRHQVPLYDVRYRGYGKNKMVHIQVLRRQKYQFHVHPEAFLVHRPHARGEASQTYVARDELGVVSNHFKRNMSRFFDSHIQQLQSGTYRPCVDAALLNCHDTLPWAFEISDSKCIPYIKPEDRDKPFNTTDDQRVWKSRQSRIQAAQLNGSLPVTAVGPGAAANATTTVPEVRASVAPKQANTSSSSGSLGTGKTVSGVAPASAATNSSSGTVSVSATGHTSVPTGTGAAGKANAAPGHRAHHRPQHKSRKN